MLVAAKIILTLLLIVGVEISANKFQAYFIDTFNGKLVHRFVEAIGFGGVFVLMLFLLLR